MTRKRAAGGGRKPKPAGERHSEYFQVRVTPEVRAAIEEAARKNERTLRAEIAARLRASIEVTPQDRETAALSRLVAEIANRVAQEGPLRKGEITTMPVPGGWHRDRFTFDAFKSAISKVLDLFAPPPDSPERSHPFFKTPDDLAQSLVFWLWNDLDTAAYSAEVQPDEDRLRGFGTIARDLALTNPRKGDKP
jgi:hypothetical protein